MIRSITRSKPADWFCIDDDIIEANDVFALIKWKQTRSGIMKWA